MATLAAIRSAIKTKLDTLTGSGQPLAYVYDHFRVKVEGYPSAVFEPEGMSSEIADSCHNLRTYRYTILILQEMQTISRDTALTRLEVAFDTLMNVFDADRTLGGLCEGEIEPTMGDFDTIDGTNGPMLILTLQLKCKTLYNFT